MIHILVSFFIPMLLLADSRPKDTQFVSSFRKKIWEDVDGKMKSMASLVKNRGLVVISYTACKTLCPTVTVTVKSISEKLESKGKIPKIIFISIDPENDSLENRKEHFKKFSIESPQWHFLKTDLLTTKNVIKSLGFSFGEKRNNEHIMHSSQLAVVSSDGRILKRTDLTSDDVDAIVSELLENGTFASR